MPILGSIAAGSAGGYGQRKSIIREPYEVEYLVIAGGGAGGYSLAGAGGAGGYLTNFGGSTITFNPDITYTISVGAGGAANPAPGPASNNPGSNTSLSG